MRLPVLKTATLLALAVCSTLALADDPPARVGRVALTQGQVSITSGGEAANAALVNWPVTSNQTISTAPGARTELRVGSTAIRLDGDSALEVVQLDDDTLRLRLHYGSASIRVVNPEVAGAFELATPQARVVLQQPGRLRVDAERVRDTSSIRVFDGVAVVEGGGERLTLRSGRSAEVQGSDLRMSQAVPDAFDEWAQVRDRASEAPRATRYVPAEMTGVEDLDRHGSWRDDSEYGALWLPSVASNWVPYRDGRWTWVAPWGWTWVDNAPWGYAPFHYGRWVHVDNRWAWAPGRLERRPVWAPALVGWVGGAGWNRHAGSPAAQGWYPLSPHDRFVPGYRLSDQHLRRLNAHGERHEGRREGRHDYRQRGLTVVPQERFGPRAEVVVRHEPRITPPANWLGTPGAQPPVPRSWRERNGDDARRLDGRDGRWERRDRDGDGRPDGRRDGNDGWRRAGQAGAAQPAPVVQAPGMITTAPPAVPQPPQAGFVRQPGVITTTPEPEPGRSWRGRDGRAGRDAVEDGARQRDFGQRRESFGHAGGAAGAIEAAAARAQAQAQAQMHRQAPTAVAPPAPRAMPAPPPAAAPQPAPAPQAAPPRRAENPRHGERYAPRQLDR
jgi:hypothetical protein